jgi:hypothetical protein
MIVVIGLKGFGMARCHYQEGKSVLSVKKTPYTNSVSVTY